MNLHTPTLDGAIFRCPCCDWRAVLANDNRLFQTQPGDAGHDHIGQALAQRDALMALRSVEVARVLARLRDHYTEQRPLPEPNDNRDDLVAAGVVDPRTLTIRQLRRLTRAVIGEHAQ